jgi:hypothetical protein
LVIHKISISTSYSIAGVKRQQTVNAASAAQERQ